VVSWEAIQIVYKQIGLRIRSIRETLGVTQSELAERVGLTRTSIVNIEAGRQRILLHDVELLAKGLTVSAKHLLRGIWI